MIHHNRRFSVCPLLTVAVLFCPRMLANEAIRLTGGEQISKYSGYAFGLRDGGPHKDSTPRDDEDTVKTCLTAIDAIPYMMRAKSQFAPESMLR